LFRSKGLYQLSFYQFWLVAKLTPLLRKDVIFRLEQVMRKFAEVMDERLVVLEIKVFILLQDFFYRLIYPLAMLLAANRCI